MKKLKRIWQTPSGDQIEFFFSLSSDVEAEDVKVYFYSGNTMTDLTDLFGIDPFDEFINKIYTADCEPQNC